MSWRSQVIEINNQEQLVRMNRPVNELLIYSIKDGSLLQRIKVPKQGKHAVGPIGNFYYHNPDSIFYTTYYRPVVFLYDSAGNFINEYNFYNNKHVFVEQFFRNNRNPIIFTKNKLYVGLINMAFYEQEPKTYTERPLIACYNVKNDSLTFPGAMSPIDYEKTLVPDPDFSHTYNTKEEKLTIGFSFHNQVLLVGNNDVAEKSNPISINFETSWYHKNWGQQNAILKSRFESKHFSNLTYDPYRNVYFQIVFEPEDFRKHKNLKITNRFFYQPFNLYVISPDFKSFQKISLPAMKYNPFDYFIDSQGFWLSLNNPEGEKYSESHISFQLFKFNHE